jgi:hypothetical protein
MRMAANAARVAPARRRALGCVAAAAAAGGTRLPSAVVVVVQGGDEGVAPPMLLLPLPLREPPPSTLVVTATECLMMCVRLRVYEACVLGQKRLAGSLRSAAHTAGAAHRAPRPRHHGNGRHVGKIYTLKNHNMCRSYLDLAAFFGSAMRRGASLHFFRHSVPTLPLPPQTIKNVRSGM